MYNARTRSFKPCLQRRRYEQNYTGTFLNSKTSILLSQTVFCKIDSKRYAFKIVQQFI